MKLMSSIPTELGVKLYRYFPAARTASQACGSDCSRPIFHTGPHCLHLYWGHVATALNRVTRWPTGVPIPDLSTFEWP